MMRVEHPELLLLLPVVMWFWRSGPRRSASGLLRHVLRSSAVVALILALSGPQVRYADAPLSAVFVVDDSGSMAGTRSQAARTVATFSRDMRPGDRAGLVLFAERAALERPLSAHLDLPARPSATLGTMTDIEAALRMARAALPEDGARRVILLSDGGATTGDAITEAARAGAAGVRVDVVVTEPAQSSAIDVLRVAAPHAVRTNESFDVVVTSHGEPGAKGVVALVSGDGVVRTAPVTLGADGLAITAFTMRATSPGINVFEATVGDPSTADEFTGEPRRAGAVVAVGGELRVLYVGANPQLAAPLATTPGFQLQTISATALPRSVRALVDFDAMVLDDVRADRIDTAQSNALRAYVADEGGGILFLGSRDTFDAGVLADNAVGELLPIDVRPRGGQRAPALGLVVAFDKSGSMDDRVDGVPRIEFARLAVRRVFDAVAASDAIGVIAFDVTPQPVAPLAVGTDVATLRARLQSVLPSGATAIAPALTLAAEWLQHAPASVERRHVLLVSDGRTSPEDVAQVRAIAERRAFQLSVVALGADADRQLLESLAQLTGGRAYFPHDIRDLPAIVARESARVAGGRIVDEPFTPVLRPHAITTPLASRTWPQLGGYVVAAAKPGTDPSLLSPLSDPILVTGRSGLGRVAAYTAELQGAWSSRLRAWSGYGPLLTNTVRWVARATRADNLFVTYTQGDDGLRVGVEAANGDVPLFDLRGRVTVRPPNGESFDVPLHATAPGKYEARVTPLTPGAYVFSIDAQSAAGGVDARTVRGVYWAADREYRVRAVDTVLLTRIAEVSGGRVLRPGDNPFTEERPPAYTDIWPWLTLAALSLFLMELFVPVISGYAGRRPQPSPYSHEAAA